MTARTIALLLMATASGCASTAPQSNLVGCATGDVQCKGQAECNAPVDPRGSSIVAENMIMSRGQTTLVKWNLAGHGNRYRWDGRGILFEPAATGVIHCPQGQSGPVRTCTNNGGLGSTNGKFKYDVRIFDTEQNRVLVCDPFVLNQ